MSELLLQRQTKIRENQGEARFVRRPAAHHILRGRNRGSSRPLSDCHGISPYCPTPEWIDGKEPKTNAQINAINRASFTESRNPPLSEEKKCDSCKVHHWQCIGPREGTSTCSRCMVNRKYCSLNHTNILDAKKKGDEYLEPGSSDHSDVASSDGRSSPEQDQEAGANSPAVATRGIWEVEQEISMFKTALNQLTDSIDLQRDEVTGTETFLDRLSTSIGAQEKAVEDLKKRMAQLEQQASRLANDIRRTEADRKRRGLNED